MVPKAITKQLITEVHGNVMYGHEGQFKTKERILQSYWWPGMDQHINEHLRQCEKCQKTKKDKRATTNFVSPLPQCTMPNQRIHMDLFGPLKTSQSGKKYIMVITDAFTKYMPSLTNRQTQLHKHYSPNGCVDTGCQQKFCQTMEKNFATKWWTT